MILQFSQHTIGKNCALASFESTVLNQNLLNPKAKIVIKIKEMSMSKVFGLIRQLFSSNLYKELPDLGKFQNFITQLKY